jgi:hypothetical protein
MKVYLRRYIHRTQMQLWVQDITNPDEMLQCRLHRRPEACHKDRNGATRDITGTKKLVGKADVEVQEPG